MSKDKERAALVEKAAEKMNKGVSHPENLVKNAASRMELQKESPKLATLEEAIRRSGLKRWHDHILATIISVVATRL